MLNNLIAFALVLTTVVYHCHATSQGAPVLACDSMTPNHRGLAPQTSAPPVSVTPRASQIGAGQEVHVVIERNSPPFTLRGFFIQARELNGQTIRGTFLAEPAVNLRTCGNIANSAATHTDPTQRNSQIVTWRAPTNFSGTIRFHVSVVQNFETFWVNILSSNVQIV